MKEREKERKREKIEKKREKKRGKGRKREKRCPGSIIFNLHQIHRKTTLNILAEMLEISKSGCGSIYI